MSDTLIKVENVSKKFCRSLKKSLWYGMQDLGNELLGRRHGGDGELRPEEFWAVKDVSFELKRGECLGLIGRNGAGKTTVLRMLNGLIKPDQGRIEIRGRVGALIALGAGFNPILTGRENIMVSGSLLGLTKAEIRQKIDNIVDFSGLENFINMPIQSYSSGMVVRLGFAVATALDPDILLLDEVLAVGDMAFRAKCYQRLSEIFSHAAIIIVSHDMTQIGQLASSVLYMNMGTGFHYDTPSEGIIRYSQSSSATFQNEITTNHLGISVHSANLAMPESLDFGDHLELNLSLDLLNSVDQADVRIVLYASDETMVCDCFSRNQGSSIRLNTGMNRLRIRCGPLYLRTGHYKIRTAILNRSNNEHLYWGTRISETYFHNAPSYGSAHYIPTVTICTL